MYLICVHGLKNSGKTTLVERLIGEFKTRYNIVCAVKKMQEHDLSTDVEGKDTTRFLTAGAERVLALAKNGNFIIDSKETIPTDIGPEDLVGKDCDVIICEGYKLGKVNPVHIVLADDQTVFEETVEVRKLEKVDIVVTKKIGPVTWTKLPAFNSRSDRDLETMVEMIIGLCDNRSGTPEYVVGELD